MQHGLMERGQRLARLTARFLVVAGWKEERERERQRCENGTLGKVGKVGPRFQQRCPPFSPPSFLLNWAATNWWENSNRFCESQKVALQSHRFVNLPASSPRVKH